MKTPDRDVIENLIAIETEKLQLFHIPPTIDYEILYESIQNENLRTYFIISHTIIVESYREMNRRLKSSNYYYLADDSRRLYSCINSLKELQSKLAKTTYSFQINADYNEILTHTLNFIGNGGSHIPKDWNIVELPLKIPLFSQAHTVEIKHTDTKVYSHLSYIGQGSFATVYKFHDDFLNRDIALKVANSDLEKKDLARFKLEFDTLSLLDSPYIVSVYSFNSEANEYTMEYLPDNLANYIKDKKPSFSECQKIARQIIFAVEYLNSTGRFHRDLSQNNVLVKKFEDGSIVAKLSDFGLVKDPGFQQTAADSEAKATHIPPELYAGTVEYRNYGIQQEVYEMTILLFFLFTGRFAPSEKDPQEYQDAFKTGAAYDWTQRPTDYEFLKKAFLCPEQNNRTIEG